MGNTKKDAAGAPAIPRGPGRIHWATDGRFRAFWSAVFTEHLRPTGFCSSALSGREYQCSWWSLEWAWTGIWDREVRGNNGSSQAFAPSGFLFSSPLFSVLFFFSLSTPPFLTFPRNTTCTPFHAVVRGGSAGSPRGKARTSLEPRTIHSRIPRMMSALDRNETFPRMLRRWLCPVTRLACGSGSPLRYGRR